MTNEVAGNPRPLFFQMHAAVGTMPRTVDMEHNESHRLKE